MPQDDPKKEINSGEVVFTQTDAPDNSHKEPNQGGGILVLLFLLFLFCACLKSCGGSSGSGGGGWNKTPSQGVPFLFILLHPTNNPKAYTFGSSDATLYPVNSTNEIPHADWVRAQTNEVDIFSGHALAHPPNQTLIYVFNDVILLGFDSPFEQQQVLNKFGKDDVISLPQHLPQITSGMTLEKPSEKHRLYIDGNVDYHGKMVSSVYANLVGNPKPEPVQPPKSSYWAFAPSKTALPATTPRAVLCFAYDRLRVLRVPSESDIPPLMLQAATTRKMDSANYNPATNSRDTLHDTYILKGDWDASFGDLINENSLRSQVEIHHNMIGGLEAAFSPRGPPDFHADVFQKTQRHITVFVIGTINTLNFPDTYDKSSLFTEIIDLGPTKKDWEISNVRKARYLTELRQFQKIENEIRIEQQQQSKAIGRLNFGERRRELLRETSTGRK
jgi:hypothetical protein